MTIPRACHAAVLLPGGKVLLAGGMQRDGAFTLTAELYDPATGKFTRTGDTLSDHVCPGTALLGNGKVLVAGSFNDPRAELYDPATGKFTPTGSMTEQRDGFTMTLLRNGKVLVTGGYAGRLLSSAELYDPVTGKFTSTGSMTAGRSAHTATLLRDGRVLITGGGYGDTVLSSAELYDPATGRFSKAGNMTVARFKHAAALLQNGDVLIVGGSNTDEWQGRYSSAEVYHVSSGTFTATTNMTAGRFKLSGAVTVLAGGVPLIAGGDKTVEIYDTSRRAFRPVSGQLDAARFYSTATRLSDGRVLIAGGYDTSIVSTAKAWIYTP